MSLLNNVKNYLPKMTVPKTPKPSVIVDETFQKAKTFKNRAMKSSSGGSMMGTGGSAQLTEPPAIAKPYEPPTPYSFNQQASVDDALLERLATTISHLKEDEFMKKQAYSESRVYHSPEESMKEYEAAFTKPWNPAPSKDLKHGYQNMIQEGEEKKAAEQEEEEKEDEKHEYAESKEEEQEEEEEEKNEEEKKAEEQLDRLAKFAEDMEALMMMSEVTGYSPEELMMLAEQSPEEFAALHDQVMNELDAAHAAGPDIEEPMMAHEDMMGSEHMASVHEALDELLKEAGLPMNVPQPEAPKKKMGWKAKAGIGAAVAGAGALAASAMGGKKKEDEEKKASELMDRLAKTAEEQNRSMGNYMNDQARLSAMVGGGLYGLGGAVGGGILGSRAGALGSVGGALGGALLGGGLGAGVGALASLPGGFVGEKMIDHNVVNNPEDSYTSAASKTHAALGGAIGGLQGAAQGGIFHGGAKGIVGGGLLGAGAGAGIGALGGALQGMYSDHRDQALDRAVPQNQADLAKEAKMLPSGPIIDVTPKKKMGLKTKLGIGAAVAGAGALAASAMGGKKKEEGQQKQASTEEVEDVMNALYKEAAAAILNEDVPQTKKHVDPMDRISFPKKQK